MMALPRTPLKTSTEEAADEDEKISEIVDISQLPPG
ncbi:YCL009Cp-like protein [Saccharomyces cerevisiae AWRI1631]|nr:YCL009Cp-like protein [Saccharomyces cerevisiae AWRI1631]